MCWIDKGTVRAVRIRFYALYHSGFEGIVLDITHQSIEIPFIGDKPRLVTPLPEMAAAAVLFVEIDGVVHAELAHITREHGTGDLQQDSGCSSDNSCVSVCQSHGHRNTSVR